MEKKRSAGIIIFTVWFFISAFLTAKSAIKSNLSIVSFLYCLSALLHIICGIGTWMLLEWVRKLIVYLMAATATLNIFLYKSFLNAYLQESPSVAAAHTAIILKFLVIAFIIFYFTRPKIKEQFKQ